jgi:hypothetical protein
MNALEVMAECGRRGIELRATAHRLEWRPADAVAGELLEALTAHRREVAAELRRDAAVADAWERLRELYARAGQPAGWLTADVRTAEHHVEVLWRSARERPDDDPRFYGALARWERIAAATIESAADEARP